jgi:hypothetical protein
VNPVSDNRFAQSMPAILILLSSIGLRAVNSAVKQIYLRLKIFECSGKWKTFARDRGGQFTLSKSIGKTA